MTRITLLVLWAVPVLAVPVYSAEKGKDTFKAQVEVKKKGDTVKIETDKDRTTIVVTSESGIGGARIVVDDGKWGKKVVLRFQYTKDRGYKKLEGLTVTTEKLQFSSSSSDTKIPFFVADEKGKFPDKNGKPNGTLELTVATLEGGLEITLPDNWLAGSKTVQLAWVDEYRR